MTTLAISFCNSLTPGFAVGLYDLDGRRFAWLDPPPGLAPGGATGLNWADDTLFVAYQMERGATVLAAYDAALALLHTRPLRTAEDVHSILWHDGRLLFCDTGHNRVGALGFDPRSGFGAEREHWRYPGGDAGAAGNVHLNALAFADGALHVSLFGPRAGTWMDSHDGAIMDAAAGQIRLRGLHHPHSLLADRGALYCLESRRGLLHRLAVTAPPAGEAPEPGAGPGHAVVARIEHAYLRGLARAGDGFVVGASAARSRSRSSGTLNAPEAGGIAASCRLLVLDGDGGLRRCDLFTPFGFEIYDVLALPEGVRVVWPDGGTLEAVARRVAAYDGLLHACRAAR